MNDAEMIDCPEPTHQLDRLRAIMHRLRAPGGCPWDAEQTHQSLVPHLLEETYETIDAIQRNDIPHLKEELGDLLLQVIFHSELAEEAGNFTLDDVARDISDKLVRRHPHVFSNSTAATPDAVLTQWDAIKRNEKGHEDKPYLHDVGKGLPALLRAAKLQRKAAKIGFDWPVETGVLTKIREEVLEVEAAIDAQDMDAVEEEIGDLLFSVVNLTRFRKLDPEAVLARSNEKFENRFHKMEKVLTDMELTLESANLDQMETAWQKAKKA